MKKIAILLKSNTLLLDLFLSENVFSQVINSEGFKTGWGILNHDGLDVARGAVGKKPTSGTSTIINWYSRIYNNILKLTNYASGNFITKSFITHENIFKAA